MECRLTFITKYFLLYSTMILYAVSEKAPEIYNIRVSSGNCSRTCELYGLKICYPQKSCFPSRQVDSDCFQKSEGDPFSYLSSTSKNWTEVLMIGKEMANVNIFWVIVYQKDTDNFKRTACEQRDTRKSEKWGIIIDATDYASFSFRIEMERLCPDNTVCNGDGCSSCADVNTTPGTSYTDRYLLTSMIDSKSSTEYSFPTTVLNSHTRLSSSTVTKYTSAMSTTSTFNSEISVGPNTITTISVPRNMTSLIESGTLPATMTTEIIDSHSIKISMSTTTTHPTASKVDGNDTWTAVTATMSTINSSTNSLKNINTSNSANGKLGTGFIVGIVICGIMVVVLILGILYCKTRHSNRTGSGEKNSDKEKMINKTGDASSSYDTNKNDHFESDHVSSSHEPAVQPIEENDNTSSPTTDVRINNETEGDTRIHYTVVEKLNTDHDDISSTIDVKHSENGTPPVTPYAKIENMNGSQGATEPESSSHQLNKSIATLTSEDSDRKRKKKKKRRKKQKYEHNSEHGRTHENSENFNEIRPKGDINCKQNQTPNEVHTESSVLTPPCTAESMTTDESPSSRPISEENNDQSRNIVPHSSMTTNQDQLQEQYIENETHSNQTISSPNTRSRNSMIPPGRTVDELSERFDQLKNENDDVRSSIDEAKTTFATGMSKLHDEVGKEMSKLHDEVGKQSHELQRINDNFEHRLEMKRLNEKVNKVLDQIGKTPNVNSNAVVTYFNGNANRICEGITPVTPENDERRRKHKKKHRKKHVEISMRIET